MGHQDKPDGRGSGGLYEFQIKGNSIAGGYDTQQQPQMPPHWLVYFAAADVDAAAKKAGQLGGSVMLEPQDFPGGRFAVASDPQGGAFGILRMNR